MSRAVERINPTNLQGPISVFIWNPDFSQLKNARVWLAAAGQVFFTLSVEFGIMACYASYMRHQDDVVVTGLSTAMTNEFAEVILGGSIAIPVARALILVTTALVFSMVRARWKRREAVS